MAQATDYMEEAVLSGLLGGTSITLSSGKPYIALLTTAPTDSSSGTECTGGGYARVQIGDTNQGDFNVSSTGEATNTGEFRWSDATSDWGDISHVAIMDSATGGNMLVFGALTAPVSIVTGDIFKIPPSGFTVQMD